MMVEELDALRRATEVVETCRRAAHDAAHKAQRAVRHRTARQMREELAQAIEQTQARLSDFELACGVGDAGSASSAASPAACGAVYNPASFIKSCDQRVDLASLVKPGDLGDLAVLQVLVERVHSIKKRKGFAAHTAGASPLAGATEDCLRLLDKAGALLRETALRSDTWAALPERLLELLTEIVEQPAVTDEVEDLQEQLKRMLFAIDEVAEQQQQAVMDGDMKLTETLYFKKITMQEAMVELFNKLFAAIESYHGEYFLRPLKRVHAVHTEANSEVASLMQRYETLKAGVEADVQRLKEAAARVSEADRAASEQLATALAENTRELADNRARQEQCLAAMEELEKHLALLGHDRAEIVQRRLETIDAHRRRAADVENFRRFYKDHLVLLEGTIETCEAAEEVTDAFDELVCTGCNAIEKHMRVVEEAVERERIAAHELRLKHFRDLYLTLGDLQYKKERNLEELDKKIAHATIQQEIAMETFNPKAKEIANMRKDLVTVREEMESQVQVLHEKGQLHIEAFKPTEAALLEAGKSFLHPVEELNALNHNRQQKLLEYHKLVHSEESDEAEFNAEAELRRIEEERKSIKPRRPVSESGSRVRPDFALASEPYVKSPTKSAASAHAID